MHEDSVQSASGETHQDELWLISYVDLLTLLLAFFVLLIASSSLKKARFEQIAASMHGSAKAAPLTELRDQVEQMIDQGKLGDRVRISQDNEGLGIEFKDALLFDSGSAEIRDEGRKVVADVAALLRALPQRPVIIEGHTDDLPIRNSAFPSNWELSSARAIHVLEALESSGVAHERMSVRAYAETRQQKSNAPLNDLRSANRRVLVRVE
jgi:chemotaxis protein MotB